MRDDIRVIGWDTSLKEVYRILRRVSDRDTTVLVTGETGTGKEVVVRALHAMGGRPENTFVAVNCGAIPGDLLESTLFGHVKGAYTGAHTDAPGRFELAGNGTVFLDEIGDMPPQLQVKLLRALQEKVIYRVGGTRPIPISARIVAATHKDLERAVREGTFRQDLYYRLNVIPVALPPLRERGRDILELARLFLARSAERNDAPALTLTPEAEERLLAYSWPGNVRELENYMERVSAMADGLLVGVEDLPQAIRGSYGLADGPDLDFMPSSEPLDSERETAASAPGRFVLPSLEDFDRFGMGLKEFLGEIENRLMDEALRLEKNATRAAKRLGVKRTTLLEKLRRRDA